MKNNMNAMKITTIKTSRSNRQTRKLVALGELMEAMKHDTKNGDIGIMRNTLQRNWLQGENDVSPTKYEEILRLPTVYPAAQLNLDKDGNKVLNRFNGLLTLTVEPLRDVEEAEMVKELAAMLPTTVAAFRGSSGRTVKVIIAATRPDGSLPKDEEAAEVFCRQAYPLATHVYQGLLNLARTSEKITVQPALCHEESLLLWAGFRMTLDENPFYRRETASLLVTDNNYLVATGEHVEQQTQTGENKKGVGHETQELVEYMHRHYSLRQNTVMGYTEYRSKQKWHVGWRPVDERTQKGFTMEARLAGINVWDLDVSRFLKSNFIKTYNPIEEYLWNLRDKWDGRDHIGNLARTVPTDNENWPRWFQTWFLGMVAQWLGKNPRYGNSITPLLISRQGYNKSTFCRSLIPKELQWGYNDNLVLSEKKSVLQAMSQFLLINLDEFNQISPKVQQGFLKNIIQLASVKVKRPYAKHVEDLPRLASFIATSNMTDVLSDPSGNRRFIGIELTAPIDIHQRINHTQLYAQAMALLEQGVPYWLDDEQTQRVMASNRQFQLRLPEELYFHECFSIPSDKEEGQFMTPTAIFAEVKRRAGSAIPRGDLRAFGRILANMEGLVRRRTRRGTEYLVTPK